MQPASLEARASFSLSLASHIPALLLSETVSKMKIDSYTHFACPAFMDHLEAESGHPMVFRGLFSAIPELSDINARIRQENHVMTMIMSRCNMLCCLQLLLSLLPPSATTA